MTFIQRRMASMKRQDVAMYKRLHNVAWTSMQRCINVSATSYKRM